MKIPCDGCSNTNRATCIMLARCSKNYPTEVILGRHRAYLRKDVIEVELTYPRMDDERQKFLEIGLCDVRSADNIRVHYDFERDGWSIEQSSIFEWSIDDPVCDPDWQEVAFIQAWGREKHE